MTIRSTVKFTLFTFTLMLVFSLGTFAQKKDCSQTTPQQIVDSIYAKIAVKYASQMDHINVTFKDGVVKLQGWATTTAIKKNIEKMAKSVTCVKSVTNALTIGIGGGCGPGTKPCGGICIPLEDTCNIKVKG